MADPNYIHGLRPFSPGVRTTDGYANPATRTGRFQDNLASKGAYEFTFWTRNRVQLEAAYRGSWVIGNAVDCVAEDMTRAGVDILGLSDAHEASQVQAELSRLGVWAAFTDAVKWGRLFGGGLGILMIDGQDASTELNVEKVGKDQFCGIYTIDRWLTVPDYSRLVTKMGPHIGEPEFYEIVPGPWPFSGQRVHYTRIIRVDGIRLPIYQRQYEQGWGMSIVERIFDTLTAFDSATLGAAQLVYKAHLRVLKIKNYKQVLGGTSDAAKRGMMSQLDNIRAYQSNEGMTVIDSEDEFEALTYAFSGLNDVLLQFGQQIAGSVQVPMTRLMGQSPAGFSTGDSDIRQYQEGIAQKQERHRPEVHTVLRLTYQSVTGKLSPDTLDFKFGSLWGMNDEQKSNIANARTTYVSNAFENGLVDKPTALRELRAGSEVDGAWNSITEQLIEEAENEPPLPPLPQGAPAPAALSEPVAQAEQQPDAANLTEAPTEPSHGDDR